MEAQGAKVRCQRIGCDAMFTYDDNPDGSCTYHDSGPLFHDGMKEWSCCKKRSHDFSLFLEIPGCKTGKHTTEKQVLKKQPETPKKPVSAPATSIAAPSNQACSRCRQGFFCSEHGSKALGVNPNAVAAATAESSSKIQDGSSAPAKKVVDIFQPQTCSNKGCGKTFKEKDNHETACSYHPGRAVFHDRSKGWSCCDVHVKEFEEFMSIPPCSRGWHSADPVS